MGATIRVIAIVFVIAFWIALLSFFGSWNSAHAQPVHPWRGYVQACFVESGERSCIELWTKDTYNDMETCKAETRAIMDRSAKAVIEKYPSIFIEAKYTCFEDQKLFGVGA